MDYKVMIHSTREKKRIFQYPSFISPTSNHAEWFFFAAAFVIGGHYPMQLLTFNNE
jgi:hypothetical protein